MTYDLETIHFVPEGQSITTDSPKIIIRFDPKGGGSRFTVHVTQNGVYRDHGMFWTLSEATALRDRWCEIFRGMERDFQGAA